MSAVPRWWDLLSWTTRPLRQTPVTRRSPDGSAETARDGRRVLAYSPKGAPHHLRLASRCAAERAGCSRPSAAPLREPALRGGVRQQWVRVRHAGALPPRLPDPRPHAFGAGVRRPGVLGHGELPL